MDNHGKKSQQQIIALLEEHAQPAAPSLYRSEADGSVYCLACAHQCHIKPEHVGVCRVRFNRNGALHAPGGYVAGLQADPIEKKPFYHVLPGSDALSFGMLGCNFHCNFCQNWVSSQIRDNEAMFRHMRSCSAKEITKVAVTRGAPVVISTYNEPLITADWAAEVFDAAKAEGLLCGFVSNGFASREVLEFLRPRMDMYKVDLKCFSDASYRALGGRLQPVLDTIAWLATSGLWLEVVTLVVPGFNDSKAELDGIARFLAQLSPDIPWHVTAFYPNYKLTDRPPTSRALLDRAYDAGKSAGLRYVYAGNMAGQVADREHTFCHACGALLIERSGFHVLRNQMRDGHCPDCDAAIPGRWNRSTL